MSDSVSPTRINLIQTKKTLSLAESGREVLERKRDILLRELRNNIYEAENAREELADALAKAYQSLREANMAKGSDSVANVAAGSSYEADFVLDFRSIMGIRTWFNALTRRCVFLMSLAIWIVAPSDLAKSAINFNKL